MFKDFIEDYLERITETKSLTDLVVEAKANHRVQQLLVPYVTKDRETFVDMKKLALHNHFAQKLVDHCAILLHDLMDGKVHDRDEMKTLIRELKPGNRYA